MSYDPEESAKNCGCDKGANHLCDRHLEQIAEAVIPKDTSNVERAPLSYEAYVKLRCVPEVDAVYCVIALNEKAGEIAGWYKKYVLLKNQKGNYTVENLKGELGDLYFYMTRMAQLHGWSLQDIEDHNRAKLDARYTQDGAKNSITPIT